MEGRRRSGILSRRNRSKWKLRHDSQGAIRRLCFTDILFLSLSSFRSSLVGTYGVKKKGRRAGITSRTGAETIVCTLRAFDFSRRNDYAIISRRVPFLLKRKTSPPSGPPWPLCNIGRLSRSRSLAKVSLSVSLSSNRRCILSSRFVLTSHPASVHFRPTGQPLHTPLTHLDPTKGSSRPFQNLFLSSRSLPVCISSVRYRFAFCWLFFMRAWNFLSAHFHVCACISYLFSYFFWFWILFWYFK